jgi:hemoglobin
MSLKLLHASMIVIAVAAASSGARAQQTSAPSSGGQPQSTSAQTPPAAAQAPGSKTLYQRLGGYDMIAKVVDAFLPKLRESDPKVAAMITGLAETSRQRNRQLIVDQICNLTGGPCLYIGRTMEASHQGLEITEDMWKKSQQAVADALDSLNIKDPEKAELIAVIEKLRPEIVQKKKEK